MLWKSHNLITFTGVLTATLNPLAAVASVAGATIPDAIELYFDGWIKHRTITHWWPMYLVPLLLVGLVLHINEGFWYDFDSARVALDYLTPGGFIIEFCLNCLFWFLVGCLCHIVEDLTTGYVPLLSPKDARKWKILFYPGSPKEFFFDLFFVLACLAYRAKDILEIWQKLQSL